MLNLVLFGPPGAGKGTQADFLIQKFNLIHISTGELLRSLIAAETPLGIIAKSYIDEGNLAPDYIVIEMINTIANEKRDANGFVFDGFPRTVEQAIALDSLLNENNTPVSGMLYLDVPNAELIQRLNNRSETSGRADDRSVAVIENRLKTYHEKTDPLRDYYNRQNKYHRIDGTGTVNEIAERLFTTVSAL